VFNDRACVEVIPAFIKALENPKEIANMEFSRPDLLNQKALLLKTLESYKLSLDVYCFSLSARNKTSPEELFLLKSAKQELETVQNQIKAIETQIEQFANPEPKNGAEETPPAKRIKIDYKAEILATKLEQRSVGEKQIAIINCDIGERLTAAPGEIAGNPTALTPIFWNGQVAGQQEGGTQGEETKDDEPMAIPDQPLQGRTSARFFQKITMPTQEESKEEQVMADPSAAGHR
jgi:hypothetical protein